MLNSYIAVIFIITGNALSLYVPDVTSNLNKTAKVGFEDGIVKNVHNLVHDFQDEKRDDEVNKEINYQQKNVPLNVSFEKTNLQHEQLSFGPPFLKIGLKPEDNNYQIPKESSSKSFPAQTRSIEDIPIQVNVSNEISNITNLEPKLIDENARMLEENIRNEVNEEIQKEKSFESTIIEVLGDIPEPEVRATFKQDLLDSSYSEKQKEISSDDEHVGVFIEDEKVLVETEKKAKNLNESGVDTVNITSKILNGDESVDDKVPITDNENLKSDVKNIDVQEVANKLDEIIPEKNQLEVPSKDKSIVSEGIKDNIQVDSKSTIESDSNTENKFIGKSSLDLDIKTDVNYSDDLLKIVTEYTTEIIQQKINEDKFENESSNKNFENLLDDIEKTDKLKILNEMQTENKHNNDMKNNSEKNHDYSTLEITENLITVVTTTEKLTEEKNYNDIHLKSVESVKMKNVDVKLNSDVVDMNIDQKISDAEHTDGLKFYSLTSHAKNTMVDKDIIISHDKQESSYNEGQSNVNQNNKQHDDFQLNKNESKIIQTDLKVVTELQSLNREDENDETTVFNDIMNKKILQIPTVYKNESIHHQLIPITSNENSSSPFLLPESGPQIKELLRSIHGNTIDDKNSTDIPLQFPDSSSERLPVLSVFSISTFEPEIFPSSSLTVSQHDFNINSDNNEDFKEQEQFGRSLEEQSTEITTNFEDYVVNYVTTNEFIKNSSDNLNLKNLINEQITQEKDTITSKTIAENKEENFKSFDVDTIFDQTTEIKNFNQEKSSVTETSLVQENFEKKINDDDFSSTVVYDLTTSHSIKSHDGKSISLDELSTEKEESTTILNKFYDENETGKQLFEEIPLIIEFPITTDVINVEKNDFQIEDKNLKFDYNSEITTEFVNVKVEMNLLNNNEEKFIDDKNEDKDLLHSSTIDLSSHKSETHDELNTVVNKELINSDNTKSIKLEQNLFKSFVFNTTKEQEQKIKPIDKEFLMAKNVDITEKTHNSESDSSSEELDDSSEEKYSFKETTTHTVKSSSEPLKLNLHDLLSKPVDNSEEAKKIDLEIESYQKDIIKSRVSSSSSSSRSHQGRSLSFDNDMSTDDILKVSHSQYKPTQTEVIFDDEIELPENFDHTVIKRPGVDNENQEENNTNSSDDIKFSDQQQQQRALEDDPEMQTPLTEILIEAAELTTDINRHILSFRTSSETYDEISNDNLDYITIENNNNMDNKNIGKIQKAEHIHDEIIEKSNVSFIMIILISLIGLITLIAISIIIFIKYKNHIVQLDIQMEEQQRKQLQQQNKHYNNENDNEEEKEQEQEQEQEQEEAEKEKLHKKNEQNQHNCHQEHDMDNDTEQTLLNDLEKQR